MTYTPAWNATFAKPLLNQCIALIQRDQASAIALVNPALAPIAQFHKGAAVRTSLPWLTVAVESVAFTESTPFVRASRSAVSLSLDVGQFDQEFAQDNAQDYARVLDMVITSASGADWVTPLPITLETVPGGLTTPPAAGAVKEVFVAAQRFSKALQPGLSTPVMNATLEVIFELQET